jgi:hypothetical protein
MFEATPSGVYFSGGDFAKFPEATDSLVVACLSAGPHGSTLLPVGGITRRLITEYLITEYLITEYLITEYLITEYLITEYFPKICRENFKMRKE